MERIRFYVDHRQERPKTPSLVMALRGAELRESGDDTFVFPVTGTLIIRPSCFTDAWYTTNTGVTLKPTIASGYTVKTSAKWKEVEIYPGAGKYLQCDDSSSEYARTTTAPGVNRGVFFSFFNYSGGDDVPSIECGWSDSATPSAVGATLGIKISSKHKVRVYESGVLTGTYTLPGGGENETVDIVMLPARRRELWFLNQRGEGFVHIIESIEEDASSPVITPAEKFFVAPGNTSNNLQIQFAALVLPSSATALAAPYEFGRAPMTGSVAKVFVNDDFSVTSAFILGTTAFAGTTNVSAVALRNVGDTADFTPNNADTQARIKTTLTGDASYTPFVDGLQWHYPSTRAWTNATEMLEVTDFVNKGATHLNIQDDGFGDTLDFAVYDPDAVNVENFESNGFRPLLVSSGGIHIFDGVIRQPELIYSLRAETVLWEAQAESVFSLLSTYTFRDRVPFDGWNLCKEASGTGAQLSAIGYVLERCGVHPARLKLSNINYKIGREGPGDPNEWNLAAEPGESGIDVFNKLAALAADCVYGSHPGANGMEFWFLSPDDLPTTSVVTLYPDMETAAAIEPALSFEQQAHRLYDAYHSHHLPLEANEIRVMGVDARTGEVFQRYSIDEASQDPETAPSLRPANWAGLPLVLGVSSRQIRNADAAERLVEGLLPIVTDQPIIAGFETSDLIDYEGTDGKRYPLWRFDMVHLDGIGTMRVTALEADFHVESSSGTSRTARYSVGTIVGRGGTTADMIRDAARIRGQRSRVDFGNKIALLSTSNNGRVAP